MALRHSRTPVTLMRDEAMIWVQAAESNPTLRKGAERYTGREWSTLTNKEKIDALMQADQLHRVAQVAARGLAGMRDLKDEIYLADYGLKLEDQNDAFRMQIAELERTKERLEGEAKTIRAQNTALKAAPAMAVDSEGTQR